MRRSVWTLPRLRAKMRERSTEVVSPLGSAMTLVVNFLFVPKSKILKVLVILKGGILSVLTFA